jgi:adenosylcobinamide-phosphate synthase
MNAALLSLLIALVIDTVIGDPQWIYHPVRLIGRLASLLERVCRKLIREETAAGITTWFGVIILIILSSGSLLLAARSIGVVPFVAVSSLCIYFSIAPRDLASHAASAASSLRADDIEVARQRTSRMVSRDTSHLDRSELVRAIIESTAENLVDGVTAPLLFAALFGPIGAVVYRAVNTMDAMFGYKNTEYIRFGRFAAKADDLFTWIPARLTGPLLCLSAPLAGASVSSAFGIMRRDRKNHESPNGGVVESAAAGALGIRLGGPGAYFGSVVNKPYIGDPLRKPDISDVRRIIIMMYGATMLTALLSVIIVLLRTHIMENVL